MFQLLLILSTLFLFNCDTRLDPIDKIPKNRAFQSVEDVKMAYLNCFRTAATQFSEWSSILTDDVRVSTANANSKITYFTWQYTAADEFRWYGSYRTIDDINRTLQAAEEMSDKKPSASAELKGLMAQLHGLRAYAYWNLLNGFSRVQQPQSLGVPLKAEKHIDIFEMPPRVRVREVLDFIETDMRIAERGIPANVPIDEFNRDGLTALEARMALETGDFKRAIAKASELISRYPLAGRNEFPEVWTDRSKAGVIMKRTYTEGESKIGCYWQTIDGNINFNPSVALLARYADDDIRKQVYFHIVGTEKEEDINQNQIAKYPGKSDELEYLNDMKLVRVAEMYFIRAEALAKSGNWTAAAQDVNAIRQTRMEHPADLHFSSQKDAIEKILEAKRKEMCYEGTRWFDLKRNGLPVTRGEKDRFAQGESTLPADDYHWLFPVPQGEIHVNDNIDQGDQNPGY